MKIKSFLKSSYRYNFSHYLIGKKYNWGNNPLQDSLQFKKESIKTIDYITEFNKNISMKSLKPENVDAYKKINEKIPKDPINFEESMNVIEKVMKDYTFYNHPGFFKDNHLNSYPAILGNLISDAYNNPGVSWISNPIGFELEHKILKYFAEKLNLPKQFQSNTTGSCVHFDSGESTNVAVLAARTKKKAESNHLDLSKFCYYYSNHSNAYVKKAIKIAGGINKEIEVIYRNGNYEIDVEKLEIQIKKDIEIGLVPCFINCNLGNNKTCGSDNIIKIGEISKKYNLWCNVDAAMLGNSLLLNKDASKILSENIESIIIDSSKTLPFGLDSAMLWVYDPKYIFKSLNEDFVLYVQIFEKNQAEMINYSYGTARLTKSFRMYLVMRSFGLSGLKRILEKQINMGKLLISKLEKGAFESLFNFEIGVICMKIKGKSNSDIERFVKIVNDEGKILLTTDSVIHNSKEIKYIKICLNDLYIDEKRVNEIDCLMQNYSKLV